MSGTVADVLSIAASQIGCTNGAKYFNELGYADGGAWCVAFVQWCMSKAGVSFPWPPSDRPSKRFVAWDYSDAPNAIAPKDFKQADGVSFDWDDDSSGDHVGIFDHFETRDGVAGFWSYEGNTSGGKVDYKWRPLSCAICGIRPTFAASKAQWIKQDGRWWYRHADGSYTTNGWEQIDDKWYYFDHEGWMLASTCVNDGTGWYALGASGAMLTDLKTHTAHDGRYGAIEL